MSRSQYVNASWPITLFAQYWVHVTTTIPDETRNKAPQTPYHIRSNTKWSPSCRRHFKFISWHENRWFYSNFIDTCSQWSHLATSQPAPVWILAIQCPDSNELIRCFPKLFHGPPCRAPTTGLSWGLCKGTVNDLWKTKSIATETIPIYI